MVLAIEKPWPMGMSTYTAASTHACPPKPNAQKHAMAASCTTAPNMSGRAGPKASRMRPPRGARTAPTMQPGSSRQPACISPAPSTACA